MGTANNAHPETLGRIVTSAASIIGLFVTANTLLTSCSKDQIERANGFRSAVAQEEKFWSDLYGRYLKVMSEGDTADNKRRSDLMAITFLATHRIPDLAEYDAWYDATQRSREAIQQLSSMRQVLEDALRSPQSSNAATAREIGFFLDQKSAVRDRGGREAQDDGAPPEVTDRAKAATAASVQAQGTAAIAGAAPLYGSRILGTGPSIGWDVDIFWCEGGPREADAYARASKIGEKLATAAVSQTWIMPGMKLGRIRLRSLPVSAQQQGGFYTSGEAVVIDGGKGEKEAAAALAAFLQPSTGIRLGIERSIGAQTNWYLSLFICRAPKTTQ